MKGTLIKRGEEDYKLFVNDTPLGQSKESPYKKLSIKNCQAIENGYGLDELASEFSYNQSPEDSQELFAKFAFTEGFQKAMELMEGKKYSEEDMREAYNDGMGNIDNDGCRIDNADIDFKDTIDYMQKYEWEVEIDMESIPADRAPNGWDVSPKLDKDGCLILKRI